MSLTKSPIMTPGRIAANRANARKSEGPATSEGTERMRDSNVRHGIYSHVPGEALRALGEDPEEFKRLLKSLEAEWEPSGELQSRLVQRLARALWRLERNDRVQESMAVERARAADREVRDGVGDVCRPMKKTLGRIELLAEAVAADQYATGPGEFELFFAVYGEEASERSRGKFSCCSPGCGPPAGRWPPRVPILRSALWCRTWRSRSVRSGSQPRGNCRPCFERSWRTGRRPLTGNSNR